MATISKNVSHSGYCPVDKDIAPIPIEYISFPDDGSTKRNMTFRKISNQWSQFQKYWHFLLILHLIVP